MNLGSLWNVKRWRFFALAGILIVAGVYVYLYRGRLGLAGPSGGSNQSTASEQGSTVHPAQIVWQYVDRTPDSFRVDMPTDAKQIQIPAYNVRGGAEQVDMIYSYTGSETFYSVAWAQDPPIVQAGKGAPEKILDWARDGALARTQTTLISQSNSNRQGYPAREFMSRNQGGGILNAQLILAGGRLYMLAVCLPSVSAQRSQDVERFFNSFKVTSRSVND